MVRVTHDPLQNLVKFWISGFGSKRFYLMWPFEVVQRFLHIYSDSLLHHFPPTVYKRCWSGVFERAAGERCSM